MDTEVISAAALLRAAEEAEERYDREHVTPYVRDRPGRFPQAAVTHDPPAAHVSLTLDTQEDLLAASRGVRRAGPDAALEELIAAAGG